MSALAPGTSLEDAEEELMVVDAMLQSLDPDADDFEQRFAELQAQQQQLRDYIQDGVADIPTPQTPRDLLDDGLFASGSSMNLPSRDAQHAGAGAVNGNFNGNQQPQGFSFNNQDALSSVLSAQTYPPLHSPSSNPHLRRQQLQLQHAASSLHTPQSLNSRTNTPFQSTAASLRQKQLQRLQAQEVRWQQERENLAYAQSLQNAPSASSHASRVPNASYQSYLLPDGGLRKQSPPSQQQLQLVQQLNYQPPGYGTDMRSLPDFPPHATFKPEEMSVYDTPPYGTPPYGQPPSRQAQPQNRDLGSSRKHAIVLDDSDEERADRKPFKHTHALDLTGDSLNHYDPIGFPRPTYPIPGSTQPGASHNQLPGRPSFLQDPRAALGPLGHQLHQHISSAANAAGEGLAGAARAAAELLYGTPGWGGPLDLSMMDEDDENIPIPPGGFARGYDPYNRISEVDSTRTREDLERLVAALRPDEDIPPEQRIGTPEQLSISLMEHQKLGLSWLQKQEDGDAKGGILGKLIDLTELTSADDMGLGKTIQAIALMATRQSTDPARRTTLIFAPVALLNQWKNEITEKIRARNQLNVFVYHLNTSATYAKLSSYDVVITTYGKLAAEYGRAARFEARRKQNPNAQRSASERLVLIDPQCKWHRVIMDEAQNIKNADTKSAQGAHRLDATYRLCMTGTPMMNGVKELYALIKFLRIRPYNDKQKFDMTFKRPLEATDNGRREMAMRSLQALLRTIMLRRTKDSKIDDKPILNLPPRIINVTHAVFEKDQAEVYDALEKQIQLSMNKYLAKGRSLKNYSYILVRLLRLRQACDHPYLIEDSEAAQNMEASSDNMQEWAGKLNPDVIERIKEAEGAFECPICYDASENPTMYFPCGHYCCAECFVKVSDPQQNGQQRNEGGHVKCHQCRAPIDMTKYFDYLSFKRVHLPETAVEDEVAKLLQTTTNDSDSDTDSDSDSETDSDADSQGDLRDFIAKDDEEIEEEEESGDEVKGEDDVSDIDYDDLDDVGVASSKGKAKATAEMSTSRRKSKGKDKKSKGKGKEKKKEKTPVVLATLRREALRNAKAKKKYLRHLRKNFHSSAKIDKTMEIIKEIHANDPTEKIVIFSQFTTFLDLVEIPIDEVGYRCRRYDGAMNAKERSDAVAEFQDQSKGVKIMLISLKAGNSGLNLTAASQVIILDPFWNPFVEEQAVDRAHRIGQVRPVMVHRLTIADTVEDRILKLQENKRALINTALDVKAGKSLSRLGRSELRFLFGLSANPDSNDE